jgi:hypothetical protein
MPQTYPNSSLLYQDVVVATWLDDPGLVHLVIEEDVNFFFIIKVLHWDNEA